MNGTASKTPEKRDRTLLWTETREGIAAGLRAYADLLESDPTVPISANLKLSLFVHADEDTDEKTAARALLRKLGGRWDKEARDGWMAFEGWLHGVPVDVWVNREAVCERRVVGVEQVTETVPIGEDTRPVETVTREVERVEWICSPLLADDAPAAVTA